MSTSSSEFEMLRHGSDTAVSIAGQKNITDQVSHEWEECRSKMPNCDGYDQITSKQGRDEARRGETRVSKEGAKHWR